MTRAELIQYIKSLAGEDTEQKGEEKKPPQPYRVNYGGIYPDPLGNQWAMDRTGRKYIAYNVRKPQLNVNDPQMSGTNATIYKRGDTLIGPPNPSELELYLNAMAESRGPIGLQALYRTKKRMSEV